MNYGIINFYKAFFANKDISWVCKKVLVGTRKGSSDLFIVSETGFLSKYAVNNYEDLK